MSRPTFPPFLPPPPPHIEHNPHKRRSVTSCRAGLPADELRERHVVPRDSLFIDLAVWGEAADSPIWGPFRPFFAGLHVAVELCATPLTRERFNIAIAKALLLGPADKLMSDTRLFILCTERPVEWLQQLSDYLSPGPVSGSWFASLGAAGQAIIAVVPELPLDQGTSALRLTATFASDEDYAEAIYQRLAAEGLAAGLATKVLMEFTTGDEDGDDPDEDLDGPAQLTNDEDAVDARRL